MLLNPKHHILLLTRPVCRNSRLCIRMQPTSLSLLSRRIVWVIQSMSISVPSLPERVYHLVGAPTIENFKHILHVGGIQNCDLTPQDVEIAEKFFGPDVSELKGKSTRRKPKIVKYDVIAVPRELKQRLLELAIDIMFICSIPMLTAIDRTIKFRSLVILNSRKTPDLYEGLDDVLCLYNGRGFYISRILCDGELQPLMKDVQDNMDITFNFAPAGEHVPEAEQNNRTIQERFRTQFHRLPYKAIPANMIKTLAMHVTHQLNLWTSTSIAKFLLVLMSKPMMSQAH
jgi:hypothetical protein